MACVRNDTPTGPSPSADPPAQKQRKVLARRGLMRFILCVAGRAVLPYLDYLVVFVMFRIAAILHGIRGRLARGNASSAHAEATAALTEPLAELAWSQALSARL